MCVSAVELTVLENLKRALEGEERARAEDRLCLAALESFVNLDRKEKTS